MSLAAFQAEYGGKESCEAALRAQRRPQGFVCPKCKGRKHSYCVRRRLYQCSACRTQTSLKAGTIFHKSKVPLTTWFLAIYLLTQSKNDISALELSRQLGVKYDTAWAIKHKLMAAMQDRNKAYKLKGDVNLGWKGAQKYVATAPQVFDLWQDPQERYDIFMNNFTERTWVMVTISDAINKLMATYVKYPPRKLQSESYSGPITLTNYQRFQYLREQLAKDGFKLELPTGN